MGATVLKTDGDVPVTDAELEILARVGAELVDRPCRTEDELLEHGAGADALLTVAEPITARVIAGLGRCRIISRFGSGINNVDVEAAAQAGIIVSNVPDFCLDEVSDHALALVLALWRRIVALDASVRAGRWSTIEVAGEVHRLRGRTLGIVGFGRIARCLAPKAAALGLRLLVHDPLVPSGEIQAAGAEPLALDDLLRRADIVSLHVPLTPATRHVIDERALGLMKPGAVLVNVSRGELVEEDALVRALQDGRLSGAGLDVLGAEPPPPDHPLLRAPNTIVTSHAAYYSVEALDDVRRKAFEEVARVLAGEPPQRAVRELEVTR
jgi:D-3-phosphoglycerate dehydrogenase